MAQTNPPATSVGVTWRPRFLFSGFLRRGLNHAGVASVEPDIWSSSDAAARVWEVTGGEETVHTVCVGDLALVNPS